MCARRTLHAQHAVTAQARRADISRSGLCNCIDRERRSTGRKTADDWRVSPLRGCLNQGDIDRWLTPPALEISVLRACYSAMRNLVSKFLQ